MGLRNQKTEFGTTIAARKQRKFLEKRETQRESPKFWVKTEPTALAKLSSI